MKIKPFLRLPKLEVEPMSDWTLNTQKIDNKQSLLCTFACQRDFLSVPKTYQIVEFFGDDDCPLEYHQMVREEYLNEIKLNELNDFGWFELGEANDGQILLMLDCRVALEIAFSTYTLHPTVYHCDSSQAANKQYLNQFSDD